MTQFTNADVDAITRILVKFEASMTHLDDAERIYAVLTLLVGSFAVNENELLAEFLVRFNGDVSGVVLRMRHAAATAEKLANDQGGRV